MEKFVKSKLEGRNRRFIKVLPYQKLQLRRGIIQLLVLKVLIGHNGHFNFLSVSWVKRLSEIVLK